MSACAQHVTTLRIHAAADLKEDKELRAADWQCPGCHVRMVGAAVDPGRTFKVIPYFRAEPDHAKNCTAESALSLVHPVKRITAQQRTALAAMAPTVLRLPEFRQEGDRVAHAPQDDAAHQPVNGERAQPDNQNREQVTSSLTLIARHYALAPDLRNSRLRIPGVNGNSYDECISRLGNFRADPPAIRFVILHAPVAFVVGITVGEHTLDVPLHCGKWVAGAEGKRPGYVPRYRVRFDTTNWAERHITSMRQNAEAWVSEQMDLEGTHTEVHLFFLGVQDLRDLTLFIVNDWRLGCFQTVLR